MSPNKHIIVFSLLISRIGGVFPLTQQNLPSQQNACIHRIGICLIHEEQSKSNYSQA